MSDIFEEVEEGLAKDTWTRRWEKYGIFVYLAVALIIGGVAFNEWRGVQQARITAERVGDFETALEALQDGDYATAQTGFRAIAESDAPLAPLAAQLLARTLFEGSGDLPGAGAALGTVADPAGDPLERVAALKAAYLRSSTASLSELESLLGPMGGETTQLGYLARELIAAKAADEGDFDRARREFGYLSIAPDASQSLVRRAEIALAALPERPAAEIPESLSEDAPTLEDIAPAVGDDGPTLEDVAPAVEDTDATDEVTDTQEQP